MAASRRYRGLLIGNASFPRDPHGLPDLHGPVADLKELRRALTDERSGLFAPDDISELSDYGVQELRETLHEFFIGSAERDDVLLLYYSGHGKLDLWNNLHLCAKDSKTSSLPVTALRYKEDIESMVKGSPATTTITILDCCYSGSFRGGKFVVNATGRGKCVITSSRANELALDSVGEGGPSPFTGALVQGLRLAETNGRLTTRELYDHIDLLLSKAGNARPQFHFDGEGEIVIAGRETGTEPPSPPPRAEPEDGPRWSDTAPPTLPQARNWRESILNEAMTAAFEAPGHAERFSAVSGVVERAVDTDVEWAERLLLSLPYGDLREAAMASLCRRLAEVDTERAMRFVEKLPDDDPGKVEQLIALAEVVATDHGSAVHLLSEAVRCAPAMHDDMPNAAVVLAKLATVFKLVHDPWLSARVLDAADARSREQKAAMLSAASVASFPAWGHTSVLEGITEYIDVSAPSRRGRLLVSVASELAVAEPAFASDLLTQADRLVSGFHAEYEDVRAMVESAVSIIELSPDIANQLLDLAERLTILIPAGEEKLELLITTVEGLAAKDPRLTERFVLSIERMAARLPEEELWLLESTAEELASVVPGIAERIVHLLPDDRSKVDVLASIARRAPSESPQIARRLADEAERLARSMVTDDDRFHAMVGVAEAYAAVDPDYALRFLRTRPLRGSQLAVAYQHVGEVLAETAPDQVQAFADAVLEQNAVKSYLCDVAKGAAKVEPDRALALISHIFDESTDKATVLVEVVTTLSSVAPARAEGVAKLIRDGYYQAKAFWTIVKTVADSDSHYAARLCRSITDHEENVGYKISAMAIVAMELYSTDARQAEDFLDMAEHFAFSIDDSRIYKAVSLTEVAQGFASFDPGRAEHLLVAAERLAHAIEDKHTDYRNSTLADIMLVWAAIAPGQAERLVAMIPESVTRRDMHLRKAAEVLARTGSMQAERFAGMITDENRRLRAMRDLVKLLAATAPARAERLANELPAGAERALALVEVAREAHLAGMR